MTAPSLTQLLDHHADLRHTAENGIRALLQLMGDDPDREGLRRTPHRVINALLEATHPPHPATPAELLATTFEATHIDQMVTVGHIPFTSLCEHHLAPFTGTAWIAYLPTGNRVVGLSKLPRLLDHYAARPQLQERLAQQVTTAITTHLAPDAACVIDGTHTCMTTRGARKPGAVMRSTSLTGKFRHDAAVRAEFLRMTGAVPGA